jgi:hypothetical protein
MDEAKRRDNEKNLGVGIPSPVGDGAIFMKCQAVEGGMQDILKK